MSPLHHEAQRDMSVGNNVTWWSDYWTFLVNSSSID